MMRLLPLLVVLAFTGCGPASGEGQNLSENGQSLSTFRCTVSSITDGDTLRCSETEADGRQIRVRLSGIAARERDGSCSPGHPCPAATPEEAAGTLASLAEGQVLTCSDEGRTFNRRAAFCRRVSDGADLSCAMVQGGFAARWERYWGTHRCD